SVQVSSHVDIVILKRDKYTLLDLRKGTADITCHQVLDEIHVLQIYPPSGGPWGSTYIDEAFWEMLCEIFGNEIMQEFTFKHPHEFIQLIEHFREVKYLYSPTSLDTPKIKIGSITSFFRTYKITLDDISKKLKEYKLNDKNHEGWKFVMDKVMDPLIHHVHKLLMEPQLRGCQT
ncbi:hypothetical protein RFI_23357, partial [Reticulomyxa filosa]